MTFDARRALSPLLPSAEQATFLRAAIGEAPVAAEAWDRWQRDAVPRAPSAIHALAPYNVLLPLLAWNLARHGMAADPRIATHLRVARMMENLRFGKYREICGEVIETLVEAGAPFLVLKGAALGEAIYPATGLRHCDDLDLLLPPPYADEAWRRLERQGWTPKPMRWPATRHRHLPPLAHRSGLPVEIHRRLHIHYYRVDFDDLWARRDTASVCGHVVSRLADTDALVHACVHGLGQAGNLRWAADAWFLVTRGRGMNWPAFVEQTRAARAGVRVYAALAWLRDALGDIVPAGVVDELAEIARRADRAERAAGLLGLRDLRPTRLRAIWAQNAAWHDRVRDSWRLAFPPPRDVTAEYGLPAWQIVPFYLSRALRWCDIAFGRGQPRPPDMVS